MAVAVKPAGVTMTLAASTLRKLAAKHSAPVPPKVITVTQPLDSEGLWLDAFRAHALLLKTLCYTHKIDGMSIDAPPNSWEQQKVVEALSTIPAAVLEEIKIIGRASKKKLHENAAIMRDQGVIDDDETIAAIFMLVNDVQITTAPVAHIGVV